MIAGRYGRQSAPGFRWVVTLANPNLGDMHLKPDLWVRLLRPNGREVWQPVEFELTARAEGAILKKLRPWAVAAKFGRYWPVLCVVADERAHNRFASIGYNPEIPVAAATVEDFELGLAMGQTTGFRAWRCGGSIIVSRHCRRSDSPTVHFGEQPRPRSRCMFLPPLVIPVATGIQSPEPAPTRY